MKRIVATFLMGFASIAAVKAAGTSYLDDVLLEQPPLVEANPQRAKPEAKVYGVQTLTMGPVHKDPSAEVKQQQREIIYVLKGPAQEFTVVEGPILDPYRQENIGTPRGGPSRTAFLKNLLSGVASPVVAVSAPGAPDSSSFGGLWNWFFGSLVDTAEADVEGLEEGDDDDIEVIEVNLPYEE